MAVPTNQMVLEFVSEQQRKVVFLQSFKLNLDKGHGHYQAFLEAMQTLVRVFLEMTFFVEYPPLDEVHRVHPGQQHHLGEYFEGRSDGQ